MIIKEFDMDYAKKMLVKMKGAKFVNIERYLDIIYFYFSNEENEYPHLELNVCCTLSLRDGKNVILGWGDLFRLPSGVNRKDIPWSDETGLIYDFTVQGSNMFDEIIDRDIMPNLHSFIVSEYSFNELGDLMIYFKNGYELLFRIDVSATRECWRYFDTRDYDTFIAVTGQGIHLDAE